MRRKPYIPIWMKFFISNVCAIVVLFSILAYFTSQSLSGVIRPQLIRARNSAIQQISDRMDDYFLNMLFILNKHTSSADLQTEVYQAMAAKDIYQAHKHKDNIRRLLFRYTESAMTQEELCSVIHYNQLYAVSWERNLEQSESILSCPQYNDIWGIRTPNNPQWFFNLQEPQPPFMEKRMFGVYRPMFNLYTGEYYAGVMVLGQITNIRECYANTIAKGESILLYSPMGQLVDAIGEQTDSEFGEKVYTAIDNNSSLEWLTIDDVHYNLTQRVNRTTGLYLISLVPEKQLFSGLRDTLSLHLSLFAIFILLAILLNYGVSKGITTPLKSLTDAMREVRDGHLNTLIAKTTNDEIGDLAGTSQQMLESIRHLLEEQQRKERERRILEARFLQSQIKPHFINNSLRTIKLLMQIHQWDTAQQAIYSFSTVLSTALQSNELITLQQEMDIISGYLKLQQISDMNQFKYHLDIEPEVTDFRIPKLLLQPLAENCIHHAYDHTSQDFTIKIEAMSEESGVIICVSDNGLGIEKQKLEQIMDGHDMHTDDHGYGLENVRKRIELYYGVHSFHIESCSGKGTTVTLHLDQLLYQDEA